MAKFSPQTNYFKVSIFLQKVEFYIFYSVFAITLIFTFLDYEYFDKIISISSLIILMLLNLCINYYREEAESSRRKDFIDNSFGSKLSIKNSIDYYDNEEINVGIYKVLVNLFQNSFFSYRVSSIMKEKSLIRNSIFIIIIICFSIYGFKNSNFALPILQLFLSKYFIEDMLTINKFNFNAKCIFDSITSIFSDGIEKESINTNINQSKIIGLLIQYESTISNLKLTMDTKVFNEMNEDLTSEWNNIKIRYSIKEGE